MTLTKAHIVENLFANNIFTKTESAHIIETVFEIMKQTLEGGEDVLSGFLPSVSKHSSVIGVTWS